MKRVLIAVAALVAVGGWVRAAQDMGGKEQEHPKMASPTKEHEGLKAMEGTWEYVMKTPPMHGQPAGEFKGTEVCTPVGGFWMVFDIKTPDMGGMPWHGHGSIGFDPGKKKYIGHFINSMSPLPMTGEGTVEGKTMTMNWTTMDHMGKPAKMREVFESKDKDHSTMTMYGPGEDGKETLYFSIEYTRKK